MTEFIDDPYNYILENCSIRDYKGYQQHREVLFEICLFRKISFRLKTPWLFLVTDLLDEADSNNAICLVVKFDGSSELVSIDNKNRITIAGRKYANWIRYT